MTAKSVRTATYEPDWTPARYITLAIALAGAAALGAHAFANSYFRVDDYAHFALARRTPILEFAALPIDVHFAPLHRLSTAALDAWAPIHFGVAIAFLFALHATAVIVLARLLERLDPGPHNAVLLMVFAVNVFALVPLSYWTSGLHRLPFNLLSLLCLAGYLRFRDEGNPGALVAALAAFALAMGFYSKAALIPATLLVFEIALHDRPARATPRARSLALTSFFLGLGFYALAYAGHPKGFSPWLPDLGAFPGTVAHGFHVLSQGTLTRVPAPEDPISTPALLVWAGFFIYSIARARWNVVVWTGLIGLIALHLAMIGLSARAEALGALTAYVYRYYFELALPLVVFGSLIWANVRHAPPSRFLPKPKISSARAAWLAVAFSAVYAAFALLGAHDLMDTHYGVNRKARDYATTLRSSLAKLEAEVGTRPALIDGAVPRFIWVYDTALRTHSGFLPLLGEDARFDVPDDPLHWIDRHGRVHRVVSSRRHTSFNADLQRLAERADAVSADDAGCLTASEPGGSIRIPLEPSIELARAMLLFSFAQPTASDRAAPGLFVNLERDPGKRLWPGTGRPVRPPPDGNRRLVDVVPPASAGIIRVEAIVLTLPAAALPACVDSISLDTYSLDPL